VAARSPDAGADPTAGAADPTATAGTAAGADPSGADPVRRLDLEGSWNFRDLGGYRGRDDRPVRWRQLFRADGLDRLTEADLVHIHALRLRTVVDLRTVDEVAKGRLPAAAGDVAWHHLPMMDVLPPRENYESWVGPANVAQQYLAMVESGAGTVAAFLDLVCDPAAYPLVFHCFAGKDRTGILTALVLGLLGVADADIVADYALSEAAMHRLLDWLRAQAGENAAQLELSASAIVAAEPETMAQFLSKFRAAHGSFETYAARLGHPEAGAALARILLEPAPPP
jgi:protein-tyrosine phosphatase